MNNYKDNLQKLDNPIETEAKIDAPIEKVWSLWNTPGDIKAWNSASEDWHTPRAEIDLQVGGRFLTRMEAKDKSAGFDLEGTYDAVTPQKLIAYHLTDGRKVIVSFQNNGHSVSVKQAFEADGTNPREFQQMGWQSILNSFKTYAEKKEA